MKTNHTFDLLIELSTHQTNQIAQQLSTLINERNGAAQQLDTLKDYRQDYAQRLLDAGKNGVTMSNYMNFRRFINTLDEAIGQQNTRLELLSHGILKQQAVWMKEKQRLNAYETLQERRRVEIKFANNKREQRLNDEMSASLFQRTQHSS